MKIDSCLASAIILLLPSMIFARGWTDYGMDSMFWVMAVFATLSGVFFALADIRCRSAR